MAEVRGADMAEAGSVARRTEAHTDGGIGDDTVPCWAAVFAYLAAVCSTI